MVEDICSGKKENAGSELIFLRKSCSQEVEDISHTFIIIEQCLFDVENWKLKC